MFEIGRAAALFADDNEVQKALRDFYAALQAQGQFLSEAGLLQQRSGHLKSEDSARMEASFSKTTELLVTVIRQMSRAAKFPMGFSKRR